MSAVSHVFTAEGLLAGVIHERCLGEACAWSGEYFLLASPDVSETARRSAIVFFQRACLHEALDSRDTHPTVFWTLKRELEGEGNRACGGFAGSLPAGTLGRGARLHRFTWFIGKNREPLRYCFRKRYHLLVTFPSTLSRR